MEFLRFGSSIPGNYWGCCAVCIIQNFKFDPDAKASIELVVGDGGGTTGKFAGPTYRDIFQQRIRIGTFHTEDMPNHGFLAVMTEEQLSSIHGLAWLKILKESGFEFLRTVDNSVYTGSNLEGSECSPHPNHVFGMFRNITNNRIKNPLMPPKIWKDLPSVVPEAWELIPARSVTPFIKLQSDAQIEIWKKNSPTKLLTKQEVLAAGAEVTLAGIRSPDKQELESVRKARHERIKPINKINAFPQTVGMGNPF